MKWIKNWKNTVKKPLEFCRNLYVWLSVYKCVCPYACVGYSFILMCVCMGVIECTNAARCIKPYVKSVVYLDFYYIILFLYV